MVKFSGTKKSSSTTRNKCFLYWRLQGIQAQALETNLCADTQERGWVYGCSDEREGDRMVVGALMRTWVGDRMGVMGDGAGDVIRTRVDNGVVVQVFRREMLLHKAYV